MIDPQLPQVEAQTKEGKSGQKNWIDKAWGGVKQGFKATVDVNKYFDLIRAWRLSEIKLQKEAFLLGKRWSTAERVSETR